jgi:cell division septation protein DedD
MPPITQLNDESGTLERRRYTRQNVLFSSAELEKGIDGIVLNVSEGGVALHALSEITADEIPRLRLQFSPEEPWIEAKGRVAWRSHSKRTAGVQFIDLNETSRQSIKNLISRHSELAASNDGPGAAESDRAENASSYIRDAVGAPGPARIPFQRTATAYRSPARFGHTPLLYVAGGLLLLASAGFVWRKEANFQPIQESKTAAGTSAGSPKASDSSPSSILNRPDSSKTAVSRTPASPENGFVLQVAALKNEKNALALADRLREKNFSAFLAKPAGSDLYRVLVGPYSDTASAVQAQADLKKEGFTSILQENGPFQ